MSACVIWMDSENAKIFKISATGIEKKLLKHHEKHPKDAHYFAHKHNMNERFFHDIACEVGDVEELLVFGAGKAKNHFRTHLARHHHRQLAQHLIGVETMADVGDRQILEAGRKFFRNFDLFHSSI